MFILIDLLFKFLDWIKPKRNAIGVAKFVTVLADIAVFITLILVLISAKNETIIHMNEVYLDIIKLYVLSIILGASISGKLFSKKSSYESESNLVGIKLILYLVPLLLVFIPALLFMEKEAPKLMLGLNYLVSVLLTNMVFYVVKGAYEENTNEKESIQKNTKVEKKIMKRSKLSQKL